MSEQSISSQLKKIFHDPIVKKKVIEAVTRDENKPIGWGRHSRAPYYKEAFALNLKKAIDGMIESGQDILYDYAFFRDNWGMSKNTVYLMVNQSQRYLLERLDPDRKYAVFFETAKITIIRGAGVAIRFNREYLAAHIEDFKPRHVEPEVEGPKWKQDMADFLENAKPGEHYKQDRLCLSDAERQELEIMLGGLSGIIASITCGSVKIVKLV